MDANLFWCAVWLAVCIFAIVGIFFNAMQFVIAMIAGVACAMHYIEYEKKQEQKRK